MALLAESLVEEWLNRNGFFTIRGVKHGSNEVDLLAVKPDTNGSIIGWHVEVQVSMRPVGYIGKWTKEDIKKLGVGANSAKRRTKNQINRCARAWVDKKFKALSKKKLRDSLWPGVKVKWTYHLVHGIVREDQELREFSKNAVKTYPFHKILEDLSIRKKGSFSGYAGGDLAEIIRYYDDCTSKKDKNN